MWAVTAHQPSLALQATARQASQNFSQRSKRVWRDSIPRGEAGPARSLELFAQLLSVVLRGERTDLDRVKHATLALVLASNHRLAVFERGIFRFQGLEGRLRFG